MTPGLAISSMIGLCLEYKTFIFQRHKLEYLNLILFLFILGLAWGIFCYIEFGEIKPILSTSGIFIPIYAYILFKSMPAINAQFVRNLLNDLRLLCFLMISLGWLKILIGSDFGPYSAFEKPLFPFSEESHYALCLSIFLISFICGAKNNILICLLLLNVLLIAVLLPSLTLLVVFFLGVMCFILQKAFYWKLASAAILIFFSAVLLNFLLTDEYFSERLTTSTFENETLLVWLQGWLLIFSTLDYSNGLGMGFQMLGHDKDALPMMSDLIFDMLNVGYQNIDDGGFLSAKIIGELGLLGIFFVFIYLKYFYRSAIFLNKRFSSTLQKEELILIKIFSGFVLSMSIEMFLRGIGYFSTGTLFFFLGAIFINSYNSPPYTKNN